MVQTKAEYSALSNNSRGHTRYTFCEFEIRELSSRCIFSGAISMAFSVHIPRLVSEIVYYLKQFKVSSD